jgi:hypothetical protein
MLLSLRRLLIALAAAAVALTVAAVVRPALASTDCTVSTILVDSCRPWLGARASGYPQVAADEKSQTAYHEQRIGRQLDIVHSFAPVGSVPLNNKADKYFAQRANTYLYLDWKPAAKWTDAGGGNATVNALIDRAAANIKALGSKKMFLTINHEPENDVTKATGCATKSGASSGTPADYVAMWHNVRARFDALGVTNVVWVMDYMNYPKWDCLVPQLYPGDSYVDWVMFNGYGSSYQPDYVKNVDHFYQLLTKLSTTGRNYLGKPWGIVEWGVHDASQGTAAAYYDAARNALDTNRFPKLKAYMVFDSPGANDQPGLRIEYSDKGKLDTTEQDAYRRFANDPAFGRG